MGGGEEAARHSCSASGGMLARLLCSGQCGCRATRDTWDGETGMYGRAHTRQGMQHMTAHVTHDRAHNM